MRGRGREVPVRAIKRGCSLALGVALVVAASFPVTSPGKSHRHEAPIDSLTPGTLDPGFSGNGRATFHFQDHHVHSRASSVALQSDGKLLLAGTYGSEAFGGDFALVRTRSNGELDSSFSRDGRRLISFGHFKIPHS